VSRMICLEPPDGRYWPFAFKDTDLLRFTKRDLEVAFVLGASFTLLLGYVWGSSRGPRSMFLTNRGVNKHVSKDL
jgi:hypothetical protein